MDSVQELHADLDTRAASEAGVQACGYLLELSLDWIVLRASENIHHLLGQSHVTLIDEPLGRFVQAQALHDLRNLFSRLSATTGIGRAYAVRLTDENELVDIAFQVAAGRVLLEAAPSTGSFGECFGSVGGLISGLSNHGGQALLDGAARRMRALTGFDRVTLTCGDERSESSRGAFAAPAAMTNELPAIVSDSEAASIALFPRDRDHSSCSSALLSSGDQATLDQLRNEGVRATLGVPFHIGDVSGQFRCDSRTPRQPNFEMHAAAELFAQMFAMHVELDRVRT